MKITKKLLLISSFIFFSQSVLASPGRINSEGCHTNKKTKTYHCHDKSKAETKVKKAGKSSKKTAKIKEKKEVENIETQTQE